MKVKDIIKALEAMPQEKEVYTCKVGEMPKKTEYIWNEKDLGVVIIRIES